MIRNAATAAVAIEGDPATRLQAAADAAAKGCDHTALIESRRGRSAKLGERSLGHVDPGAASACLILAAMADAVVRTVAEPPRAR